MLRFQLISDIHGRFNRVKWDEEADLVLCAGDVSENVVEGMKFLKTSPAPVIFIPGNHEFYKGNYLEKLDFLKESCEKSNGHITFADNEVFYIEDTRIISSTMWSNFNNFDPLLVSASEHRINDYNYIKTTGFFDRFPHLYNDYLSIYENYKKDIQAILRGHNDFNKEILLKDFQDIHRRYNLPFKNVKEMLEGMPYKKEMFSPAFSYLLHQQSVQFLEDALSQEHNGKTIVMTHHAPSPSALSMSRFAVDVKSVDMLPILKRSVTPNKIGPYTSSMEYLVKDHKNIDAWVHGHLHDRMLYRLGTATVHCNATGISKNSEKRTGFDNYCFYLNDEFKLLGLNNLINHTIYKTKKINLFLQYLNDNKMIHQTFNDLDLLRGIYYENFCLIKTLKTVPEIRDNKSFDLSQIKTFKYLIEKQSLDMIIKEIIKQNIVLLNGLNDILKEINS